MERKTNIWIIENIKPEWTLESRVTKALWARGENRRAGRLRDARENEWSEKERKTKKDDWTHSWGTRAEPP